MKLGFVAATLATCAAAMTMAVVDACSARDPASSPECPSDLPPACPVPPPSFETDVSAVFAHRCSGCHTDGGVATSNHDFSTYDGIHSDRSTILDKVYACQMPPSDAGQPTLAERATLLDWLVCKAPNN